MYAYNLLFFHLWNVEPNLDIVFNANVNLYHVLRVSKQGMDVMHVCRVMFQLYFLLYPFMFCEIMKPKY